MFKIILLIMLSLASFAKDCQKLTIVGNNLKVDFVDAGIEYTETLTHNKIDSIQIVNNHDNTIKIRLNGFFCDVSNEDDINTFEKWFYR